MFGEHGPEDQEQPDAQAASEEAAEAEDTTSEASEDAKEGSTD